MSAGRDRVREALKAMQEDALSGNPADDTAELRAVRAERAEDNAVNKLAAKLSARLK